MEAAKIVFIREGLLTKRLKAFEGAISDMSRSLKKFFINDVYRPPYNNNKDIFSNELSNTLSHATRKYENILMIGDLNIDTSNRKKDNGNYLSDLCDTLSLKNAITDITCIKSTNEISMNVFLTNKSKCFHHISTFETGLSDCHKLIFTFFKTYFKKLPSKYIEYRNYKTLTKIIFFTNLTKNLAKGLSITKNIINMTPLKISFKMVRVKGAPFTTKKLGKATMNRSKLKNRFTK